MKVEPVRKMATAENSDDNNFVQIIKPSIAKHYKSLASDTFRCTTVSEVYNCCQDQKDKYNDFLNIIRHRISSAKKQLYDLKVDLYHHYCNLEVMAREAKTVEELDRNFDLGFWINDLLSQENDENGIATMMMMMIHDLKSLSFFYNHVEISKGNLCRCICIIYFYFLFS